MELLAAFDQQQLLRLLHQLVLDPDEDVGEKDIRVVLVMGTREEQRMINPPERLHAIGRGAISSCRRGMNQPLSS